jgi:putative membrane protein
MKKYIVALFFLVVPFFAGAQIQEPMVSQVSTFGSAGWGYGMQWFWFLVYASFWILFLVAFGFFLKILIQRAMRDESFELLKQCYVKGEMTKEQFEERRAYLKKINEGFNSLAGNK